MTRFILSYDLEKTKPDPHPEFLRQAEALGWSKWIKLADGKFNKLPNTTLHKSFENIEDANKSYSDIVSKTKAALNATVNVEKVIIIEDSRSRSFSNEVK
ncbi:hypothetical protein [Methylobacterium terrae]|uniref:hypothetical protein n=1 Tax=Methylobacterium terrae TaxID=2202827 RepID=UPI0013A55EC2|nr:hypothetical protein [Methylobacterium terrae]